MANDKLNNLCSLNTRLYLDNQYAYYSRTLAPVDKIIFYYRELYTGYVKDIKGVSEK